jgi:hypothetical protein
VPSDHAYAVNGPGHIGPNSTLIYEVELLDIEKASEKPAAEAVKPGAAMKAAAPKVAKPAPKAADKK